MLKINPSVQTVENIYVKSTAKVEIFVERKCNLFPVIFFHTEQTAVYPHLRRFLTAGGRGGKVRYTKSNVTIYMA